MTVRTYSIKYVEGLVAENEQLRKDFQRSMDQCDWYAAENERLRAVVDGLQKFVDLQAEDEGLWFIAQTAPEAYVQRGLRDCHQYIEEQLAALEKT